MDKSFHPTLYKNLHIYAGIKINHLRAKCFKGSINIYLHFMPFLHIGTTQVVEILPQVRQELTYST